ncbi:adenylate kinase [uncultured Flavonifractor sp.]|uniref:adenylate kinase n=1 Tax=uncultured Flavonifractor sp. TaxID=1193534 RepID=UPI00260DC876|nr:adenylate kinase [uncultured Flavonifractor sp.]
MKIILLGAPGAGKGTQAEILSAKLNIPTISTGNILRAAVKEGTPTGLKAKSYMDAGKLVPDEVIIGIIGERLAQSDCAGGFILDGVPRTIAQAEALEAHGIHFDAVLSLEIADSVIEERMTGRRTCHSCGATYHIKAAPPKQEGICDKCGGPLEQRKDDQPETVKHRLEVYHSETEPLKGFYQTLGVLTVVPDMGGIEETNNKIMELLGK